jgi:beta-barrel assembly-enhancing protease
MFKTIEKEGGSRGPEWLSSHPNPGNRYDAINREAQMLKVKGRGDTGQFQEIQARLGGMSPAYTAEQIAKGQAKRNPRAGNTSARSAGTVEPPSSAYRPSSPFPFLRLNLPANWSEVSGDETGITYAPEGGYRATSGNLEGVTHGFQVGVASAGTGSLQEDTDQLVEAIAQSNPQLRRREGYSRETIGGRTGVRTTLVNQSDITGQPEVVQLATTRLADGRLLYLVGVAPQKEAGTYNEAFKRVRQSVQLSER